MHSLLKKLTLLSKHLILLDRTFKKKKNYTSLVDYTIYSENLKKFEKIGREETLKTAHLKFNDKDPGVVESFSFIDEIYSASERQMKLADIMEFLIFSRGVYYLFQSNKFKKERVSKFLELNLRLVNLLMIYETLTVDTKLRKAFLNNLKPLIKNEHGFNKLLIWPKEIGLSKNDKRYNPKAPNYYFDTLLPKTAGGLWHEILVYCFILKYDIGYIFPLLLTQKPISLQHKLSPPDLIILHNKTYKYYGIEIGNLKERQSGGFMAPSGIPVIPIDTKNARISDRCPTCKKWIGICPKVISDFSNTDSFDKKAINEVRCLTDCNLYSLDEKLSGKCKYMKFKYKNKSWRQRFKFADGKHYHYHCCYSGNKKIKNKIEKLQSFNELKKLNHLLKKNEITTHEKDEMNSLQEKLKSNYSFIKTHSIFYPELSSLHKMNSSEILSDNEANDVDENE